MINPNINENSNFRHRAGHTNKFNIKEKTVSIFTNKFFLDYFNKKKTCDDKNLNEVKNS